jgi:hypothetical protein
VEILPEDQSAWEHFWRCRNATAADQPLDLEKALRLHERLYGECDDMVLVTLLSGMDRAFLEDRAEKLRSESARAAKAKK